MLKVGDYPQINLLLENVGRDFILTNRHESVRYWIEQFPETQRAQYPYVNFLSGEVNRYNGYFDIALEVLPHRPSDTSKSGNQWGVQPGFARASAGLPGHYSAD